MQEHCPKHSGIATKNTPIYEYWQQMKTLLATKRCDALHHLARLMQQVSKGIIICNIQFTIGVLIHRTPERTAIISVQYALNNIIFVINDAGVNLRIIMLDLAYKDLMVCFIMSASSDKPELISWPKYL